MNKNLEKKIKKNVKSILNFPSKGILFRDITPLLFNPEMFNEITIQISKIVKSNNISKIVGIDARGFIFASAVAYKSKIPFVLIRKKGKLPGKTVRVKYSLEYGYDELELSKDKIKKNDKVLIIDDLLATGGTAIASSKLVSKFSSKKIQFLFIIELIGLNGLVNLKKTGSKVNSLCKYGLDEL